MEAASKKSKKLSMTQSLSISMIESSSQLTNRIDQNMDPKLLPNLDEIEDITPN